MRIFISAGEPSGDIHGANLVRELQRRDPSIECVGFGGDHMAAAGCRLLYPLCRLAVMWFARVLANAPTFLHLLSRADRYFRHKRPDAVVLIDYPGFHWWLARRAHFHGIPVFYFVPPQLWGWAGWRIKKMQRWVDHVLCSLPFEEPWYRQRGVDAEYVGHPFFDELPQQRLDQTFLQAQKQRPQTIIAILPGSRTQELSNNLASQIRTAQLLHRDHPNLRFLVASFRPAHQAIVDDYLRRHPGLPIETHVGRTPEIIELSRVCLTVSGSVSLELLYRRKPSAVIYRIGKLDLKVALYFKTSKYICLVNLLADKELFPEYLTDHCPAEALAQSIRPWLRDEATYAGLVGELTDLRERVAAPGACARTAQVILSKLAGERAQRRAA
jgi:lipid-A-disaccharide synthase